MFKSKCHYQNKIVFSRSISHLVFFDLLVTFFDSFLDCNLEPTVFASANFEIANAQLAIMTIIRDLLAVLLVTRRVVALLVVVRLVQPISFRCPPYHY